MKKQLESIFFDLDNTLLDTEKFRITGKYNLIEGAYELITSLINQGIDIYIVSAYNGNGPEFQHKKIFYSNLTKLINHEKIQFCPQGQKTELIQALAEKNNINLESSLYVGDRISDIVEAQSAGMEGVRMLFGKYRKPELSVNEVPKYSWKTVSSLGELEFLLNTPLDYLK